MGGSSSSVTAVTPVGAEGTSDSGKKGPPPMTPKDKLQMEEFEKEFASKKDSYKNGPISNRSISDCLCCLIFIVAIVGFCAASAYGWQKGNPELLILGWDSDGNGCGYSEDTKDYPYLYWPEPPSLDIKDAILAMDMSAALKMLKFGTCVKECPTAVKTTTVDCHVTEFMLNSGNYDGCIYQIGADFFADWGLDFTEYTKDIPSVVTDTVVANAQYPYRYDTKKLYTYCVPDLEGENTSALSESAIEMFGQLFQEVIMNDKVTQYFADVYYSWKVLALGSLSAIVLGYLYLLLIRLIGAILVWFTIFLLQAALIAGGYYVWKESENPEYEQSDYKDWIKYSAYGIWGVAGLYFLCVCCCWKAIRLGIAVYQTTAQYIAQNLRIFLLPLIAYFFCMIWFCVWLVSAIFVFSIGTPAPRPGYEFITEMQWDENTRNIAFYQIFMLFWINAFIMGLSQFVIGASACIWYFEVNSDTGGKGTVGRAMWWAFRYHMGSVAFGSFLIAVCQMIRFLFEYYRRKIQVLDKNPLVKCLLCYTAYLLWLMEKCIKFITKNAYIQVALSNTFFCKAAWNAFALILKNVARFGWLHTIGSILNWFGVCLVSVLNAFGAYIALTKIEEYKINVTQPLVPSIILLLMSFIIVKAFLSIFSYSLDAILQAFLLDEELGFGGSARPDNMSKFKGNLEKNKPS